jgi:hypothetical protein
LSASTDRVTDLLVPDSQGFGTVDVADVPESAFTPEGMDMRNTLLIAFLAVGLAACEDTTVGPSTPADIQFTILGGNAQTGRTFEELPEPLVVLAELNGKPWKKQVVNFVVTQGGGHVFAGSALTDNTGVAKDYWTLGDPGEQELQVRAVDGESGEKLIFATFHATAELARTSVVQGAVTVDGEGISGVAVTLSGPAIAETTTGQEGDFRFSELLAGDYTVTISRWPGDYEFPQPTQHVNVQVDETAAADFVGTLAPWQRMTLPDGTRGLSSLWGTTGTNVFAVGDRVALHFDGAEWRVQPSPENAYGLHGAWGFGTNDVWSVSYSNILHLEGSTWNWVARIEDANFWGIWGLGPQDLFAFGSDGVIYHFDGSSWVREEPVPRSWLRGMHGSGGLILAVGGRDPDREDFGFILRRTPQGWVEMPDNPIWGPNSVWVVSETLAFVTGERGLAQFDGESWQLLPELPDRFVPQGGQAFWASSATDLLIGGQTLLPEANAVPTLLLWDGTSYTDVTPAGMPINAPVQGVWGTADGSTIFIAGSEADASGNNNFGYVYRWSRR